MVLAMLTLVAQTALVTVRWQQLISQCGAELSFARLFRIMMTAAFFNQTLPSSVGGDAMRIWLVGKQSNWRVATYSVILDRAIGIAALAALVVICLPWTLQLIQDPVGRIALLVIGLGSLGGWFVFIVLGWERLHILQRWTITRHLAATATIAASIFRTPRSLVLILVLSVLVHLLNAVLAWCVARSINVDLSLEYSLFLVLPGGVGDSRADLNRRLGRARRRDGCCFFVCRPVAERRSRRFHPLRYLLSHPRCVRRAGLGFRHREAAAQRDRRSRQS